MKDLLLEGCSYWNHFCSSAGLCYILILQSYYVYLFERCQFRHFILALYPRSAMYHSRFPISVLLLRLNVWVVSRQNSPKKLTCQRTLCD